MRTQLTTICLITTCLATANSVQAEGIEISGPTMGTYFKVVVDDPPEDFEAAVLQDNIKLRLQDLNRQMSTWDNSSEISQFNASQSTEWIEVSSDFLHVATEAKRIHELTDGAFDPTVEPLIRLWGFGDQRERTVPDEDAIQAARSLTGMQHVEVRAKPPSLRKLKPELQLNFSAIAKGYAVDALAELLMEQGLQAFVVDIGGENRAGAPKSSGAVWKLGVESPLGGLRRIVELTNSSIATSGDYRNFFQMDGVTYSHAIDPTTGWPVKNPPASVSVIAESCMTADAWATAMMVLGVKRGSQVAEANSLSVMFQDVSESMTIEESAIGNFAKAQEPVPSEVTPASTQPLNAEPPPEQNAARWFPFAAAAVIFLIAIGGMAVGTMLQNKSLKGSCGGLASMPGSEGKSICELCTIPKDECTNAELREQMQQAANAAECADHGA